MFAYTLHVIAHESRQMWCQRRNQQQVKGPHASSPQTWAVELDFSCVWHCSCLLSILLSLFSPETSYRLRRTDILLTAQLLDSYCISVPSPSICYLVQRCIIHCSSSLVLTCTVSTLAGFGGKQHALFLFFILLFSVASRVNNFTVFQQGYRPSCWNIYLRF